MIKLLLATRDKTIDRIVMVERAPMCEALDDCVPTAAALCALSKFSHGVTLLMKLNIESIMFAGVGSEHFSNSATTQDWSRVMSLHSLSPKASDGRLSSPIKSAESVFGM